MASTPSFVSIGQHVSINDVGQVAFVGAQAAGEAVYVSDVGGVPRNITGPASSTVRFGVGAWINNNGVVAARLQRTGVTTGTFAQRIYDGNDVNDGSTIATGGVGELFPFPIHLDDFDAVFSFASLNNNIDEGLLGFSNVDSNIVYAGIATGSTLVAVDTPPVAEDIGDQTFAQNTPVRPAIADDGRIVMKTGPNADSSLILYNAGLGTINASIASSARGFTEIGRSPGISDNGRIVTFYGNLANPSACTSCDTTVHAGPGIFASVQTATGRVITQVAGAADGFTQFDGDFRIGVNSTAVDQRGVTVAYIGTRNGTQGIYTSRLNFYGVGAGPYDPNDPDIFNATPPVAVIEAGDAVPGIGGTAQTFGLFDPQQSRPR